MRTTKPIPYTEEERGKIVRLAGSRNTAQKVVLRARIVLNKMEGLKQEDIADCTDPKRMVETCNVLGGPSPAEVKRALKTSRKAMAEAESNIAKLKKSVADAKGNLNGTVESYEKT